MLKIAYLQYCLIKGLSESDFLLSKEALNTLKYKNDSKLVIMFKFY